MVNLRGEVSMHRLSLMNAIDECSFQCTFSLHSERKDALEKPSRLPAPLNVSSPDTIPSA